MLVGFPAGGPIDLQARLLSRKLTEHLKQPVVVENRPGADAVIATELAARAAPDGHTVILVSVGFATTASFHAKLPYDPLKDLVPVAQTATLPLALIVHPSVPAQSLQELIAFAKSRPGELNYGSGGIGSSNHLGAEYLAKAAGILMTHVPYKGAAPAMEDLLAGRIHVLLAPISNALPHIRSGKVRALGVSTLGRSAAAPEVPAISEVVKGFDVSLWSGVLAPAGTPKAVVDQLSEAIIRALAEPDVRDTLLRNDMEPVVAADAVSFGAYIRGEFQKWADLTRGLNLPRP
ncbi:MAG: tripartite tricarboxylate transporter substrate binding protein [Hydrogenophaga sp.]|nr:tripartite tricarboxylate transporter substrate binding protein [Hydrogenophaga sp.]